MQSLALVADVWSFGPLLGQQIDGGLRGLDLGKGVSDVSPRDFNVGLPGAGFQESKSGLGVDQLRLRRLHGKAPAGEFFAADGADIAKTFGGFNGAGWANGGASGGFACTLGPPAQPCPLMMRLPYLATTSALVTTGNVFTATALIHGLSGCVTSGPCDRAMS